MNLLTQEEWLRSITDNGFTIEQELLAKWYEQGATKELDFDLELELDLAYENYLEGKHNDT